jgi:GxxExxY protein
MNMDKHGWDIEDLTRIIIGCAFKVHNKLGCGFLEKIYENAMVIELKKAGLRVQQQYRVPVLYDGQVIGEYVADLFVEDLVSVELKCASAFTDVHLALSLNYLAVLKRRNGLLFNFAKPKLDIKSVIRD